MSRARTGHLQVAWVFAGGDPPAPGTLEGLHPDDLVVAADSGLAHVRAAGLVADVVVGDLDSVTPDDLAWAAATGIPVERHPADKDATDLELAIDAARVRGADRIVVVGAGGGRLDHFLANVLLLASPAFADLALEARSGGGVATVVWKRAHLTGTPGDLVSLLALGGPARGVTTVGLRWALADEDLHPGSSRGVSNELTAPTALITLTSGVLLAVRPERT